MGKKLYTNRKTRKLCARLAIDALHATNYDEADAEKLFSLCVFFEHYIVGGADFTQKRMKLLPNETAELYAIHGGKI